MPEGKLHAKRPAPPASESVSTQAPPTRAPWLWRAAIVLALVGTVAIVIARKPAADPATDVRGAPPPLAVSHAQIPGVPRLVDVGADQCVPCKAMAPILAQLRFDYAGRMRVDFIDVWKNPEAGDPYGVSIIPTQIFYGGDGRELERHQGFFSREDILATWMRHGYDFGAPNSARPQN